MTKMMAEWAKPAGIIQVPSGSLYQSHQALGSLQSQQSMMAAMQQSQQSQQYQNAHMNILAQGNSLAQGALGSVINSISGSQILNPFGGAGQPQQPPQNAQVSVFGTPYSFQSPFANNPIISGSVGNWVGASILEEEETSDSRHRDYASGVYEVIEIDADISEGSVDSFLPGHQVNAPCSVCGEMFTLQRKVSELDLNKLLEERKGSYTWMSSDQWIERTVSLKSEGEGIIFTCCNCTGHGGWDAEIN